MFSSLTKMGDSGAGLPVGKGSLKWSHAFSCIRGYHFLLEGIEVVTFCDCHL